MPKSWKPVAHRILVLTDEIEKQTKSGILLPTDERMEANARSYGVILSIGEDAWAAYKPRTAYAGLEVGDRVAYAKYAGKWIGDRLLILNDDDIVAKEIGQDDVDPQET